MISEVLFLSRQQATDYKPDCNNAVISIRDPSAALPNLSRKFSKEIYLEFDDDTEASCGLEIVDVPDLMPNHESGRRVMVNGNELCDYNDAKRIVDFMNKLHDDHGFHTLVVHCEAGISRSAAVAQFARDRYAALIATENKTTDGMNRRLYRLLTKVLQQEPPLIHELPEGHLNMKKSRGYVT